MASEDGIGRPERALPALVIDELSAAERDDRERVRARVVEVPDGAELQDRLLREPQDALRVLGIDVDVAATPEIPVVEAGHVHSDDVGSEHLDRREGRVASRPGELAGRREDAPELSPPHCASRTLKNRGALTFAAALSDAG
jgi:hypothetical protein